MAVTLGIDITQNGYDEETYTSIVVVSVRAYYTAGSYNATGNASGTLYINGVSYPFKTTFNSMQQDSGNEVIYSETVVIDHTVTNVVNCSATFNTGVSSGTISASNSLTLEDSSSGGDSGDEEETEYSYTLVATIGEGTVVKVKTPPYYGSRVIREITESKYHYINNVPYGSLYLYAEVLNPETHELTKFYTINTQTGAEIQLKNPHVVNGRTDYTSVRTSFSTEARPKSSVHIDTGEGLEQYFCCIDDGTDWGYYIPYIDNGESWDMYC